MSKSSNNTISKLEKSIKFLRIISLVFAVIGCYGCFCLFFSSKKPSSLVTVEHTLPSLDSRVIKESNPIRPWDLIPELSDSVKNKFQPKLKYPESNEERRSFDTSNVYLPQFKFIPLTLKLPQDTLTVLGYNKITNFYLKGIGARTMLLMPYKDFNLIDFIDNTILIKFLLLDSEGDYVGHIYNNIFFYSPKYPVRIAFDKRGFEALDRNNNIIFSFFIVDGKAILIQGYIYYKEKNIINVWGPLGDTSLNINCTSSDILRAQQRFCHPSLYEYPAAINFGTRKAGKFMPVLSRSSQTLKKAF